MKQTYWIAATLLLASCASGWTARRKPLLGLGSTAVERVLGKPSLKTSLDDRIETDAKWGLPRRTRVGADVDLPLPDWSLGQVWQPGRKELWCWGSATYVVFAADTVVEVWAKTGLWGFGFLELVQVRSH